MVYIINLPEHLNRRRDILGELRRLGLEEDDPKISIPYAPKPIDPDGFYSRGVHGNFLSHLNILKDARNKQYKRILILEDDALLSRRLVLEQHILVKQLKALKWDLCFLGHSLTEQLLKSRLPLVETRQEFMWMHCFMVDIGVYDRLIQYLEQTLNRSPGHPDGGRMYIDGAYNMFRRHNADVITFLANPSLSIQRGGPSSLGIRKWYDKRPFLRHFIKGLRVIRDEAWRRWA